MNELRNTVINLLQGLVDRGVLTKDQAEAMVRDAQAKAAADSAVAAAQAKAEEGAVRVPYVPQIVKDEISKQVAAEVAPQVTKDVIGAAQSQGWGIPAALPEWVRRTSWYGDMRTRVQGDLFADGNSTQYVDFQRANTAGGVGRAGLSAFANTTTDRERLRARLRIGFETDVNGGWKVGARLATGSLTDPVSTNQTLGTNSNRYQVGLDLAYLEWSGTSSSARQALHFSTGRIRNPFVAGSELVWDQDLTFEGISADYHLGLSGDAPKSQFAFLTVGAFPLEEVELASDKWLFGGQLGVDWKTDGGARLRLAGGYYYFWHTAAQRNSFESNLLDYTAPRFLQRGNTLFDIRNDNDNNTNLFGLAADYRLVNISTLFDWPVLGGYSFSASADYVRNIGYSADRVFARSGRLVPARDTGYQGEIGFGTAGADAHAWRAFFGYRYIQSDAVVDAFTDSDFRLGGTDAKGFIAGFDYSLTSRVRARARYLSGNELDGEPFGVDVLQLDLTASF